MSDISPQIKKENDKEAEEATSSAATTIGGLLNGKDKKVKAGETAPTPEEDKLAKEKKAAELAKAKQGATSAIGKLLGGGKDQHKAERYGEPPTLVSVLFPDLSALLVPAIQEKLDVAQARLIKANSAAREREAADIDGVKLAIQEIEKGLDTQVELLKTFPNLIQQVRNFISFSLFDAVLTLASSLRPK